jgi:hypothetical protein
VRVGDRVGIAALVYHDTSDKSMDTIPFCHCVRESLENKQNTSLSSAIAISSRIEWLAGTGRAQEMASIEPKIHLH